MLSHVFGLAEVFAWVTVSVRSGAAVALAGTQKAATAAAAIPIVSLLVLAPTFRPGRLLLFGALGVVALAVGPASGQDADKKCTVLVLDPDHDSRANPDTAALGLARAVELLVPR